MKATELKTEVEEIAEAECHEILGRHSHGRIAIVADGQPQIFPVNGSLVACTRSEAPSARDRAEHHHRTPISGPPDLGYVGSPTMDRMSPQDAMLGTLNANSVRPHEVERLQALTIHDCLAYLKSCNLGRLAFQIDRTLTSSL